MTTELLRVAEEWRDGDPDPETRAELDALLRANDEAELRSRFAGRLAFGTAGLRGILGAGSNRMNRAIVLQTTAGLATYLLATIQDVRERGIVIGYDGRHKSRDFADDAASVLAAHGIRAHVFPKIGPTPLIAYAVLELNAAGGIMVTASHNPPAYNGYKVYWENGAQIIPPHDIGIARAIDSIGPAKGIARMGLDEARKNGLLLDVSEEIVDRYLDKIEALLRRRDIRPPLSIVFTPLHGAGGELAKRALEKTGFTNVAIVAEQAEPDGDFPTVDFPNPEEPGAMDLALALAANEKADLVLANDPDADRLAVAVQDGRGGYLQLTGNEIGVLLGHYLLTEGEAGGDRLVISTIVSSPMLGAIAGALGVSYEETLTGFKWIANTAMDLAKSENKRFVFGYEEALGYSVGELVRDKDGISAACLFAELASVCKENGRSILDRLEDIAREYGLYVSSQRSVTVAGADGRERMAAYMQKLRARLPEAIGGKRVLASRDYLASSRTTADGKTTKLTLPASDVLTFELEGGDRVIVRPSGTEPKIKFYFDHREPIANHESMATARERAMKVLESLAEIAVV